MAKPLDYHDGRRDPLPTETPAPQPVEAVPVEFDTLLMRTAEHAAARAIIDALNKAQIASHATSERQAAQRIVILFVRDEDGPRAKLIAAEIFVRRKKFKSYAKVEKLEDSPSNGGGSWVDGFAF